MLSYYRLPRENHRTVRWGDALKYWRRRRDAKLEYSSCGGSVKLAIFALK
jgi:hypothetical protein